MPRIYKRNCDFCGQFYIKSAKRFCSRNCFHNYYSGERVWNFDNGKKQCVLCDKWFKFDYKQGNFKGRGKYFCGDECAYKGRFIKFNIGTIGECGIKLKNN